MTQDYLQGRGNPPGVSSVELQASLSALSTQINELCQQRSQLTGLIAQLKAELADQREASNQLEAGRSQQNQMIAFLWDMAFPAEKVNDDLKNYPPVDQCHTLQALLPELRAASQAVVENRGK